MLSDRLFHKNVPVYSETHKCVLNVTWRISQSADYIFPRLKNYSEMLDFSKTEGKV